ncbi:metallophosphoesterase [Candidatus Woesearchaeota archaeon]|nr:metallophosphoesterase [Candidatus Woesearchaeota archaeon]
MTEKKAKDKHPGKKLRIFSAGDLHSDSRQAERLAKEAYDKKADVVILSGDITFFDTSTENMIGPFKKRHLPVLIIPGNHESVATTDFLAKMYDVKSLHGYSAKYKHVGIFGAGGANIGPNVTSEKELYDLLKKGFDDIKVKGIDKKLMVTHVHPSGTQMEKLSKFIPGSSGVRRAVEKFQPDILICSHIHEAEGLEEKIGKTKVINVGKKGRLIEI